MEGVVKASDSLAKSTDASANKTLSGLKAWERYQFVTDNIYRSVQKADQAIKVLTTAFEQKRMSASRFREELEKVWESLDKVGVPRDFSGGDFDGLRKQAQETLRIRQQEAELQERMRRNQGVLRGGFGDTAHVEAFRKFQAEQLQGQRELRNSIRGNADAQVEAFRNYHQEQGSLLQMEKAMAMEVAGFDKQRLAERASMEAKAHEMVARAMPLEHARAKFGKETVEIQKWRTAGIVDETQKVALLADAQKRLNIIETAHARTGGRFSRAELTNVSYQLNDIVTMAASGANFSQIIATQGPQLFQIVQGAGGEGGLIGGFKSLGAAIGALITPTTMAITTLVAGAGTALVAWTGFDNSIKGLERSLIGLGRATPATAAQLSAIAENAAGAAGLSRKDARAGVGAMAGTGRIDPRLFADALTAGKDLAVMTGQDLPDAMQTLSGALADPAKGAAELDAKFNLFNATQLRTIERMAASGDRFGAAKAIIDALNQSIGQASETTSGWTRIWEQVSKVGKDAMDALGQDIDEVFNGATDTKLLDKMRRDREQARQRRDQTAGDTLLDEYNRSAAVKQYDDILKRYDEQIAKMEGKLALGGMTSPMEASINLLSKDLYKLTQDFDPLQTEIEDTTDKLRALYRIMDDPNSIQLPQGRLNSGIDFQQRRLDQQQLWNKAGGREQADMLRDTGFNASVSGITEFGRSLAEIDKRYADLNRQAEYNIQSTERLNRVLEANTQARQNEIEGLARSQAMSLGRRVVPEMFELGDLQNQLQELEGLRETMRDLGMTAEQVEHVLGRARAAIANYQTYAERLAQDYKLQQQEIAAVTFEQKAAVEAERARIEAIRAGRTELEAAAAAEAARNNALARSQRQGWEALRDAREQAGMVGLKPFQRDQAEIGQRFERMRSEQGDSEHLRNAEALEKWAAAQEAIRGPLEDSNSELNDQIRLTAVQAQTYGGLVGEIEAAAEAQRLMNEYLRAGIQITPELTQAIQTYAERAGQLKQVQYTIREQQQTFEDIRDMGKDALKGFISDLKEGKSAGEAFLNVMEKMLDRILDMMLNSLFDPNSQKGFNIFGVLQSLVTGKSPSAGSAGALPAPMTTPFGGANGYALPPAPNALTGPMPTLGTYGSPAINQAIAGSVPTFKQATAAISTLGASAGQSTQSFDSFTGNLSAAAKAIRTIESGSPEGNYGSLGKVIRDPKSAYFGDRAYGAYQVMGKNVPAWTQQHYGERLTPDQFLGNRSAQDAVFQGQFGGDMQKYGAEGAARMWYGGPRALRDFQRADVTSGGQTTGQYGSRFGQLYQQNGGGAAPQMESLSTSVDQANTSFTNLNPNLSQFDSSFGGITSTMQKTVPQLEQATSQIPAVIGQGGQGVGNALENTAGVIGQGSQGIGGALNQLGQALSGAGGGGGGGGFGGLGSLLGGLGGGGMWGGFMGSNMSSWTLPSDFSMSFFHEGGRVGGGGGRGRRMTAADYFGFLSAPRFHSGTKGSLRHDERRAILQTDEEVLSRREASDYRAGKAGGGKGGATVLQPQVNIINPPSEPETRTNPDGSVDVIFDQFEGRMADRAKRGRGPLVKAIGSRREGNALIG